jgi:cobalamin biosynthesis protein CobD/CbiB
VIVIVIVIVIVVIVIVDSGLPGRFLYRALGECQSHKGEKEERTKQHDA